MKNMHVKSSIASITEDKEAPRESPNPMKTPIIAKIPIKWFAQVGAPLRLTSVSFVGSKRSKDIAKMPRTPAIQIIMEVFKYQRKYPMPKIIEKAADPVIKAA
jgi:hypothetical protein